MIVYLVKTSCEKYANLLCPVEGSEGPAARVWRQQIQSLKLNVHLPSNCCSGSGLTSVFQASSLPSLESHGWWHPPPSSSWPPVYLLPSLPTRQFNIPFNFIISLETIPLKDFEDGVSQPIYKFSVAYCGQVTEATGPGGKPQHSSTQTPKHSQAAGIHNPSSKI